MLPEAIREPVLGLFSICVAAAALEALVGEGRMALSFRSVCALAASVCAVRVLLRFMER